MKRLFTVIILLIASFACLNASDWHWKHPTPTGNGLRVVKNLPNVSTDCFIIGGDNGYLAISYNAGSYWNEINLPTTSTIVGIVPGSNGFSTAGSAAVITKEGDIYSTNGNLIHSLNAEVCAVKFDNGTAYIVCENSKIYTATDPNNWQEHALSFSSEPKSLGLRSGNIYIGTGDGVLYRSTDACNSWNAVITDNAGLQFNDITFSSDNIGYAIQNTDASGGQYYKTTDGGATWTSHRTGQNYNNLRSFFLTDNIGAFVCQYGYFMFTINGGDYWTEVRANTTGELSDIDYNSDYTVIGISEVGEILRLTKAQILMGQLSGDLISSTKTGFLLRDIAVNGQNVLSVGENGAVIRSADHGDSWSKIDMGLTTDISACGYFGNDTAYCVTEAGTIYRSIDGGLTWKIQTLDNERAFYAMTTQDDFGYIVGEKTTVYYTSNRGKKWSQGAVLNTTAFSIYGVTMDGTLNAWLCGANGKIAKTTDGGELWNLSTSSTSEDLYGISIFGSTGFAVGNQGTVVKTSDGGATWSKLTFPVSKDLRDVYTSDGTNVIAVGEDGTLYGSEDGGASWKKVIVHTGNTLYRIAAETINGSRSAWISGGVGTVLYSTNPMAGIKESGFVKTFGNIVNVYPNPAGNVIRFNLNTNKNIESVNIIDLTGNSVKSVSVIDNNEVNIENLTGGYYIVKFSTADGAEYFGNFIKK